MNASMTPAQNVCALALLCLSLTSALAQIATSRIVNAANTFVFDARSAAAATRAVFF